MLEEMGSQTVQRDAWRREVTIQRIKGKQWLCLDFIGSMQNSGNDRAKASEVFRLEEIL
jgi:hypothetical protein